MTQQEHQLVEQWQRHREAPPDVRLEADYDASLEVLELALNAPEGLQGEPK